MSTTSSTEDTFGQKAADWAASHIGSWSFLIAFNAFIAGWMILNTALHGIDVFPFILLNLMLSWLAGVQAPLIMISQNRQEEQQRQIQLNTQQTQVATLHIAEAIKLLLEDHRDYLQALLDNDETIEQNVTDILDIVTQKEDEP